MNTPGDYYSKIYDGKTKQYIYETKHLDGEQICEHLDLDDRGYLIIERTRRKSRYNPFFSELENAALFTYEDHLIFEEIDLETKYKGLMISCPNGTTDDEKYIAFTGSNYFTCNLTGIGKRADDNTHPMDDKRAVVECDDDVSYEIQPGASDSKCTVVFDFQTTGTHKVSLNVENITKSAVFDVRMRQ